MLSPNFYSDSATITYPLGLNRSTYALAFLVISLISELFYAFFYAGFYGSLFLKMNARKIGVSKFFLLAAKKFGNFLVIRIVIELVFSFFYFVLQSVLSALSVQPFIKILLDSLFFTPLASFLSRLFFVFAYPLAILGFFSDSKLKPIRTSFVLVIKHCKKIAFIILLLLLSLLFKSAMHPMLVKIVGIVATSSISFLVMIYSYLFLMKEVYGKLKFDFKKVGS